MASFFGHSPKTISGEIIVDKSGLHITTRVKGTFAGTKSHKSNLDSVLLQAADDIYYVDDPPTLGSYYYAGGDTVHFKEVIAFCFNNDSRDDKAHHQY